MRINSIKTAAALTVFAFAAAAPSGIYADGPGVVHISDGASVIQQAGHQHAIFYNQQPSAYCVGCQVQGGCVCGRRGLGWLRSYSPGHGWAVPGRNSVQYPPMYYQRYYPSRWYGQPGGPISKDAPRFPMVYTPTDTTQLGYYYQVAPHWQANPGMIPSPRPACYHDRRCPGGNCGCQGSFSGGYQVIETPASAEPELAEPPAPTPPEEAKSAMNF